MEETDILLNDRYRLIEKKGSGSFGEVWLARDLQLEIDVAVKMYIALDDRGIEEFKKEYRTAYNLNHPNLLHAYHFDIFEKRPFLVMPYCPSSATSLIGNCGDDILWRFIKDVASGLSYLHSLDIVHHDIKPDNVLITEDGRFVITDFGISTNMRSTLRRNSTRTMNQNSPGGSLAYMGPEMFTSRPESVKATDIWALGITLYEMIAGELPFFGQGGVMMLNGAEVPELDYPDKNIVSLVNACLSKETWDRPTAEEIVKMAETKSFISKNDHEKQGAKKTVDLKNRKNQTDSSNKRSDIEKEHHQEKPRNWFVKIWIWTIILSNLALAVFYVDRVCGAWARILQYRIIGLCCILAALGGWLMWKYMRIGYWLFAVVQTVSSITSLTIWNTDTPESGIGYFVGNFFCLAVAFGILQIRKNGISAWVQMDNNLKHNKMIVEFALAAFCALIMIFIPNEHVPDANEKLGDYQERVRKCKEILEKNNPAAKDLLEAKKLYNSIKYDECSYSGINRHYNESGHLNQDLDSLTSAAAAQWASAADSQESIGNLSKAQEFYSISLELYENSDVREKLVKLEMQKQGQNILAPHYSGN